jgi:hypothetical protein
MTQLFVDTLANEAGTGPTELTGQSAAKAWANIGQTSSGHPTNGAFNVGSTTDDGNGLTRVDFTNNMTSSGHSTVLTSQEGGSSASHVSHRTSSYDAQGYDIAAFNTSNTFTDMARVLGITHGTLA